MPQVIFMFHAGIIHIVVTQFISISFEFELIYKSVSEFNFEFLKERFQHCFAITLFFEFRQCFGRSLLYSMDCCRQYRVSLGNRQ